LAGIFQSEVKPVNPNGNIHRVISVSVAKFLDLFRRRFLSRLHL